MPNLPFLKEIFKIGQWLRAKLSSLQVIPKRKRIQLSIEPEVVNATLEDEDLTPGNLLQCSIKSIEDHGVRF